HLSQQVPSLLPYTTLFRSGVSLNEHFTSQAVGISGDAVKIYYGDVEFHIIDDADKIAWRTTVGFVEFGSSTEEVVILGHGGCLRSEEHTSELQSRENIVCR